MGRIVVFLALAVAATAADYENAVQQWRAEREAKLNAEDGWLTVVGLYWLKPGENRVGSNPGFEIPLPSAAPKNAGVFSMKNGKAVFKPAAGAGVTMNGKPASPAELKPDTEPKYDVLAVGRVKFYVIKREDKLGIRVKDNDSDARKQFTGLRWYPIDPAWKFAAAFIPWDSPHKLTFDTATGMKEQDESPGYVVFHRNGQEYRMEPVVDDDQLMFVMRDQTSGKTTYAASRFLYVDLPKTGLHAKWTFDLDFNKAENPPCMFTDFATCPLPPPQNRLPFAVTAGEQIYGSRH
jgi:uncharacterized protein (DUF1684 family)